MTLLARRIIDEVADEYCVCPKEIVGRSRKQRLVYARVEIAKRLRAHNYTTTKIGRALNRDHCTVCFYLGNTTAKRPKPQLRPVWRRPKVRHLNCHCKLCYFPEKKEKPVVVKPAPKYLRPYAGADWREYQWKLRA